MFQFLVFLKFFQRKNDYCSEVNQWRWLEESGPWLENVDRTHLVLASCKLVLQKVWNISTQTDQKELMRVALKWKTKQLNWSKDKRDRSDRCVRIKIHFKILFLTTFCFNFFPFFFFALCGGCRFPETRNREVPRLIPRPWSLKDSKLGPMILLTLSWTLSQFLYQQATAHTVPRDRGLKLL